MKPRIFGLLAIAAFALAGVLGSAQSLAQNAYIMNSGSNTVSVIDTTTNAVTATIPVGSSPLGVAAVTPDGSRVYITNDGSGTVSVFNAATNTVIATIPVGGIPDAVAVTADGSKVYVTALLPSVLFPFHDTAVLVIDTASNMVVGVPLRLLDIAGEPAAWR